MDPAFWEVFIKCFPEGINLKTPCVYRSVYLLNGDVITKVSAHAPNLLRSFSVSLCQNYSVPHWFGVNTASFSVGLADSCERWYFSRRCCWKGKKHWMGNALASCGCGLSEVHTWTPRHSNTWTLTSRWKSHYWQKGHRVLLRQTHKKYNLL